MFLFDIAMGALVSNPKVLTAGALRAVPESIAMLLFDALYQTGTLTPRLVEAFLDLEGYDDLRALIMHRNIALVGGKPWTPPLCVMDDYKRKLGRS